MPAREQILLEERLTLSLYCTAPTQFILAPVISVFTPIVFQYNYHSLYATSPAISLLFNTVYIYLVDRNAYH